MSLSEQREKDKVGPRMSRLTPEREAMLRKHIQSDDVEYGSVVLSVENCNLLLAELDALRAEKNKYHDQWYSEAKRGEEERGKLLGELDRLRSMEHNLREQLADNRSKEFRDMQEKLAVVQELVVLAYVNFDNFVNPSKVLKSSPFYKLVKTQLADALAKLRGEK